MSLVHLKTAHNILLGFLALHYGENMQNRGFRSKPRLAKNYSSKVGVRTS
jgi:hypothetical protein